MILSNGSDDPKHIIINKLQNEYEHLIKTKWYFLNNEYKNDHYNYHRTELQEIKHIDKIKIEIEEKLGVLATFVFITDFCSKFKLPGPYRNIDKALIILYHMVCGISINQMVLYLDVSNYFRIYRYIFIKKYDDLNDWINNLMYNCFSNKSIRLLTSYYKNPELAKHVTLLLDGHHNRIIYEDIDIDRKEMYSWKLKKPGLNTQFILDLNKIVVYVSESLPCRDHNDDLMFINNIEFKKFLTSYDNICFDGLYENTLLETIEKYKSNVDMDLSNFTYPINKTKNKDLEENEERFNRYIGGFRSTIESYFSFLGSTFKRFSGQNNIRVTKLKTYNVQLRLACLLLNIKQFSEVSNLNFNEKYSSWTRKSFDYPTKIGIIPKTEPIIFRFNSIESIKNKQIDLLTVMLNNNSLNDDIDIQNNNIGDNNVDNNKIYEIQYIISDRINKEINEMEYLVKWKKK